MKIKMMRYPNILHRNITCGINSHIIFIFLLKCLKKKDEDTFGDIGHFKSSKETWFVTHS